MHAKEARSKLNGLASPAAATMAARFFKTGPGEYGEGDKFIGVRVPVLRKLAVEYRELPLDEVEKLLQSPINEERLLALLILVLSVSRCEDRHRKEVYDFYFRNIECVNNWNLVDSSAPAIVGGYLWNGSRQPLTRLAKSPGLWERRISIIATQHFIRLGEYDDTLQISRLLLADQEDLIHKAAGWILREVGNRDESRLRRFLDEHLAEMPRTMLRYAIEKLSADDRRHYLKGIQRTLPKK
jgi:3-methyladenine DNA glycosylase AlkD